MEPMLLWIFQYQVLSQCEFLLISAEDVNIALKTSDVKRTFCALQNLLNAAANISKALWGQAGRFAVQRKDLRDSIDVSDSSPLRTVTMRNNFEHFDERLDRWWNESKRHNFADLNTMPKASISGIADIDRFRMFDPSSTDLHFWGQDFNIQKITNEVQRILPKLREKANEPHRTARPTT
jgi:hypothetical protein